MRKSSNREGLGTGKRVKLGWGRKSMDQVDIVSTGLWMEDPGTGLCKVSRAHWGFLERKMSWSMMNKTFSWFAHFNWWQLYHCRILDPKLWSHPGLLSLTFHPSVRKLRTNLGHISCSPPPSSKIHHLSLRLLFPYWSSRFHSWLTP